MPVEIDQDSFEVLREFAVRPAIQLGNEAGENVRRWWVHCFRNKRLSGSTPYNYDDATACVRRLLRDGWNPKPDDRDTLTFLSEIAT